MRLIGFLLACYMLASLPHSANASTVTMGQTLSYQTTDWTPFELTAPDGTPEIVGSEIFEEDLGPSTPLALQGFGGMPRPDWAQVAFDLTFSVASHSQAITAGLFELLLPGGTMIATAGYTRADGAWHSRQMHSSGNMMLSADAITALITAPAPQLSLRGGVSAFVPVPPPSPAIYARTAGIYDLWALASVDGSLSGSVSFTLGYGAPTPGAQMSAVPLPASGLLLVAALMAGIGLNRRH